MLKISRILGDPQRLLNRKKQVRDKVISEPELYKQLKLRLKKNHE